MVYFLPVVIGVGVVVGGDFVDGGFFVVAVESAADFVGALSFRVHFLIGWCDFERCTSLAIIHSFRDETALPCPESPT